MVERKRQQEVEASGEVGVKKLKQSKLCAKSTEKGLISPDMAWKCIRKSAFKVFLMFISLCFCVGTGERGPLVALSFASGNRQNERYSVCLYSCYQ